MHKTNHLKLDAKLLKLFITVYETQSVSRAAIKLGQNQSSVSHALDRLRVITGDALFVRAGRGITPTDRANRLIPQAREILKSMQAFTTTQAYDPCVDTGSFTILANDYEIQTVLSSLIVKLRQRAPNISIQIKPAPSKVNIATALREERADIALCPALQGLEHDLMQQTLFEDKDRCFFDSGCRDAPNTLNKFCKAAHAMLVLGSIRKSEIDIELSRLNKSRQIAVECSSFTSIATVIRGSDLIATMPSKLSNTLFFGLASCTPPVKLEAFQISQIWHARNHQSARHQWLRRIIKNSMN